jgi:hypothetical protein
MVLSQYLPGATEENHENFSHDSRYLGRDLSQRTPESEAGVLTIRTRRDVW